MSDMLVAQCPHCQTRFRLSQDQLQAAAGNVRCGACLKVFDARAEAQPEPRAGSAAVSGTELAPQPPEPAAAPPRQGGLLIDDNLELDDLDLEALGLDESILEEINPDARTVWDLESSLDNAVASQTASLPKAPDALDDRELHEAFKAAARAQDFEPRPNPVVPSISTPDAVHKAPLLDIDTPMRPLTAAHDRDRGIFLRDRPGQTAAGNPSARLPSDFDEAAYPEPQEPADGRREPGFAEHFSLPELMDEPLYLDDRPLARRPRRQWLWGLLSALAALALLSQALIYNYAALAHDARSRPLMEQICFLAGCELPARVNIELIRSSNLVVRPHADYPNALAIDVILYNRADFAQPFPVLRMTFADLTGRELSSKLFRPAEYLGGELAGSTLMPPQTPVHVELSMLDPGTQTASYHLDFLSP